MATITVNGVQVQVFEFGNNSYAYIPNQLSWTDAKVEAEGFTFQGVNGHLATVTSAEENNFIVNNILPLAQGELGPWLGGTDPEIDGFWKWITGEPWIYTAWDSGQPDGNVNGEEKYLHYHRIDSSGTWNDLPNTDPNNRSLNGYIIEFDNILMDLVGTSGNDTLNGNLQDNTIVGLAGNDLLKGGEGEDTILGGAGKDTLDGGSGADLLIGGLGDDTYIVDSTDTLMEKANGGNDLINANFSYTLGENLENLTLTGSGQFNGIGNQNNNVITGNKSNNTLTGAAGNDKLLGGGGNDILIGGLGQDTLTGGLGQDKFVFNSPNDGVDRLTDFANSADKIQISAAGFGGGLTQGAIAETQFTIGFTATTSTQRFFFDGSLYFDADGSGSQASVKIATFTKGFVLFNNIEIIA